MHMYIAQFERCSRMECKCPDVVSLKITPACACNNEIFDDAKCSYKDNAFSQFERCSWPECICCDLYYSIRDPMEMQQRANRDPTDIQ